MKVGQDEFHSALRRPDLTIPSGFIDDAGAPAGRRFNVYRNNVTTSLMDALGDGFPVIKKLLGEENFRNIAREYQASNPPSSPLMIFFGQAFPQFLADFKPLEKIPYLSDVAKLEFALRQSYHAADATPIDPARLGEMSEEQLLASQVTLAPSLRVVTSPWPIVGIWQFNTVSGAEKPAPRAECAMITRPEFDPMPELITPADAALLMSLQDNQTLAEALTAAQNIDEAHDFGRLLGRLLAQNALVALTD